MIYADSSFIGSAYVGDANTGEAQSYLTTNKPRLPFVFLHWPEVTRAIFKQSSTPDEVWNGVSADVLGGLKFHSPELDAERVGKRAAGMMRGYIKRWPSLRSLDVMHVAAAVEIGAKKFLSFDSQQRLLASVQSLEVWPKLSDEEKARL